MPVEKKLKNVSKNNMKNNTLDKEEKQIVKDYEAGKYRVVTDKRVLDKYRAMFSETLVKRKNINIRVSERDLHRLKVKAAELGLPYQTLVSSVLHQYGNQ